MICTVLLPPPSITHKTGHSCSLLEYHSPQTHHAVIIELITWCSVLLHMLAVAHIVQQADHASLHTLIMYTIVIDPSVSGTKKYICISGIGVEEPSIHLTSNRWTFSGLIYSCQQPHFPHILAVVTQTCCCYHPPHPDSLAMNRAMVLKPTGKIAHFETLFQMCSYHYSVVHSTCSVGEASYQSDPVSSGGEPQYVTW